MKVFDSPICGIFCSGFIEFMLINKRLTDFPSPFPLYNNKK